MSQVPAPASGPPGSGPVDTKVTLEGERFVQGEPVKIYWNEVAARNLLAEATVPAGSDSFTATVTIPQAPADTHTIVARTSDAQGRIFEATTSFTVTGPGAPATGGGPGGDSGPTSPGRTSPAPTSPGTTPAPLRGGITDGSADGGARGGGRDAATVTAPGTGSTETNRAPSGGSPADVSPGTNGTVIGRSDTRVFADSTAPAASSGASAGSSPPRGGAADSPGGAGTDRGAASELSASGDLWGGFSSASQTPSLSGAAGPAAGDASSSMTVGLGLLGLGLVALFTGFGAADVRRRRRVAASAQGRSRQR